jgi:hypothetical protein
MYGSTRGRASGLQSTAPTLPLRGTAQTGPSWLEGPNAWNLGAPNGQQRVDDILNIVHQYYNDCS